LDKIETIFLIKEGKILASWEKNNLIDSKKEESFLTLPEPPFLKSLMEFKWKFQPV